MDFRNSQSNDGAHNRKMLLIDNVWNKWKENPEYVHALAVRLLNFIEHEGRDFQSKEDPLNINSIAIRIREKMQVDAYIYSWLFMDVMACGFMPGIFWWDKDCKRRLYENARKVMFDFDQLEVLDFELSVRGF